MKKAQAALEFLTTYGWAFLVILIMMAALSYFGVLSPQKLLPDKCVFQSGISCGEYAASGNEIVFSLTNNLGEAQVITGYNVTITGIAAACTPALNASSNLTGRDNRTVTYYTGATAWNASQTMLFMVNGCAISTTERPSVDVRLLLRPLSKSFAKPYDGEITAKR